MAAAGPPNPNNYPAKDPNFIYDQVEQQDQFDYYRTFGYGKEGWDPTRRSKKIARLAQPVRAAPIDVVEYFRRLTRTPKARRLHEWRIKQNRNEMEPSRRPHIPARRKIFTRDTLNDRAVRRLLSRTGLRFVRVLGWVSTNLCGFWSSLRVS